MKQSVSFKVRHKANTFIFHVLVTAIREKYFPVERVREVLRRRRHKNVARQLFTDDVVGKSSKINLHLPNVNPIMQFVAGMISRYFSTQSSVNVN